MSNPAKAWNIDGSAEVFTASGYTSEDTILEDVVRVLVKAAFKGRDRLDATSFILQANWQEGSSSEGSYFTGTATVVT